MQIRHSFRWVVPAALSAVLVGCGHSRSNRTVTGYSSCDPCDSARVLPRGRLSPLPVAPPPGAPLPVGPPPVRQLPVNPNAGFAPPGTSFPPGPIAEAPPAWRPSPDARLYPPPPDPSIPPQVGEGGVGERGKGVRLSPPEGAEAAPPRMPPATTEEPSVLPVDVPGYAIAKKLVASGQKPFADGVNWLRAKGYRTVVHVRLPGSDDSADRRLFESKGFKYITLEVAPDRINRDMIDLFNRAANDEGNLPLYVYDRDGSLAGSLWYLYFRTSASLSDDRATEEAGRLGLNTQADGGAHRDMWLAVQSYLQMGK